MTTPPSVRNLPAEKERGQAKNPDPSEPAEALGVPVMDSDGHRVGQLTDAAMPLEENVPHVAVLLDEPVRQRFGLEDKVVDVQASYVHKDDDGTVRLREPIANVLREQGFNL